MATHTSVVFSEWEMHKEYMVGMGGVLDDTSRFTHAMCLINVLNVGWLCSSDVLGSFHYLL